MRLRIAGTVAIVAFCTSSAFANPRVHRGPTHPRTPHVVKATVHHAPPKSAGISVDRATAIQRALIKGGYMTGEPTGVWDSGTQSAMQKLQGDNGWQTKLVPDSRAIIKLGLGPNASPAAQNLTADNPTEGSSEARASGVAVNQ